jgi:hypothetical protein
VAACQLPSDSLLALVSKQQPTEADVLLTPAQHQSCKSECWCPRLSYAALWAVAAAGDYTPDLAALLSADIIIATPEKWDGISRNWQSRGYVKKVSRMAWPGGKAARQTAAVFVNVQHSTLSTSFLKNRHSLQCRPSMMHLLLLLCAGWPADH